MEVIRFVLATIFCWGVIIMLGVNVINGLRTGVIRHSTCTDICRKKNNPLFYYFLLAVNIGFILMLGFVWFDMVLLKNETSAF